jgi:hypothetical protein
MTSEVKKVLIELLIEMVGRHQKAKALVTEDLVTQFLTPRKLEF